MDPLLLEDLKEEYDKLSADGFRVIAIAYRDFEPKAAYHKEDEQDLILKATSHFSTHPRKPRDPRSPLCRNTESRSKS